MASPFLRVLGTAALSVALVAGCGSDGSGGAPSANKSPRPKAPSTKKMPAPKPKPPTKAPAQAKNEATISAKDLGSEWPFTVASGTLKCTDNAITFTAGGKTYGVNGTATGRDNLPPIDPIWKPNPDIPGTKVNVGPVIDRGLELCGK